ncbi:ShlB/FhaC/HecB family hemolysin secretion/activation protein [uncultured Endozoicomonas sp.]|uniref:ShlB/FhaC/HecB family hemolysin secretion/activation protein n=1 Tax=uncultured Endozoicomonas sp. TaxID=432652 RepID=UPI00261237FE|nr:ShlB/FhaC/HecB family hemolysin secretion/activation protein [uncultured Endozoicomonas sp.]
MKDVSKLMAIGLLVIYSLHGNATEINRRNNINDLSRLNEERQQNEERRARLDDKPVILVPHEELLPSKQDEQCFDVQKIDLQIQSANDEKIELPNRLLFLKKVTEPYSNQCLGINGVTELVHKLTLSALELGYSTTRFFIPEQDLNSGHFIINVVPGHVGDIRTTDDKYQRLIPFVFPMSRGDLLNLRDIEQGLEQINRVGNLSATMQFLPSDEGLGFSDVLVIIQKNNQYGLSLSADDSGPQSLGKWEGRANLTLFNPLGVADQAAFGFTRGRLREDDADKSGVNFSYELPFGYNRVQLLGSIDETSTTLGNEPNTFTSTGESKRLTVKVDHLFHRDQLSKWSASFKFQRLWSRSYINDTEIEINRRYTAYAEGSVKYRRYIDAATLDAELSHRRGVPWFGAQQDISARSGPTFSYGLNILDIGLGLPFTVADRQLNLYSAFRAQHTDSELYSSEMFSIGGRYTVRGYGNDYSLLAEEGFYFRNELSSYFSSVSSTLYTGVDYGKLFGESASENTSDQLAGFFVGIRASLGNLYSDLFVSTPLTTPDDYEGGSLHASISLSYRL